MVREIEPEKATQSLAVPSEDPKSSKDETKNKAGKEDADGRDRKDADKKTSKEDELNEEDLQLKNELEMLVERLKEDEGTLYRPALESLRTLIRTSTSSMTSVPKPLKFLRPHFPGLKSLYTSSLTTASSTANEYWRSDSLDKSLFAEILSVLAMTYSDTGDRETLAFRIEAVRVAQASTPDADGKADDPGVWGHEYMRHLAAEIGEEYNTRVQRGEHGAAGDEGAQKPQTNGDGSKHITASTASYQDLLDIAMLVVPFSLKHNAEADAVDLLLELEAIDKLVPHVDKDTYARVCLYMVSCVNLLVPPDDIQFLRTAHEIYHKHDRHTEALVLSLRIGDKQLIRKDFEAPQNPIMKKQLAFLLGRQNVPIEWLQEEDELIADQDLIDAIFNTRLSEHFISFAKELNVYEPKSLEDIYKTHLENSRTGLSNTVDSARGNLASTFVNAFVNAGFGNDKLMVGAEEGDSWIYKNKDHGMLSAAASLGMSLLWDTEMGMSHIDKYTYSSDENVKAGALMAYGILHSGVRTEMDAALALLTEHVDSSSTPLKVSAIVGIGLAYAGSHREDIVPLLLQHVSDETAPMEVAAISALALGLIFVGSAHEEITPTILQSMMEREPTQLDDKWARFMSLGLAMLFLGQQDQSDATIETLKAIEHPISLQTQVLVDMCSYAGTGNVLKIQTMLHHCLEHIEKKDEEDSGEDGQDGGGDDTVDAGGSGGGVTSDAAPSAGRSNGEGVNSNEEEESNKSDLHQAYAVLGVALLAMGEDVGAEMTIRHLSHLMHYGEPVIRRSVPLAIALLNPSNPAMSILDTLSKYSHDNDLDVAINAILAMGIVGAGTNNARLAQMLRQLAGYYHKEPDCLFMVRIAQGLVHMGKGLIGINPFHTDRSLMSRTAVCGLLSVLISFTDAREFVLSNSHWLLYLLTPAMFPRFLITLDEDLKPLPVSVRVGKAVDVVGQAGKPRTISGFQTHTTPVRLNAYDRAELGTEEYLSYAHVLESFAILRKNPGFENPDEDIKMT
ncbi:26S proteasome regulatory complex, non-ATPase subcomplex, Rpn1 subunit [Tilletiaria anomala UBC 951]|uniref:26S proteasome regulatory subunit RPN1 n=1 Tax=Tilletiaria anomala (strain ATCC 24038 / CBS 436.72 / UBC 951) TaxID=1037660 RepID=A0A066VXU7_TILAU|nr:26S proteasome regulatory complex, non-ATPase subcomplex, Rpn1 subunit [Tilletiaria anomala UBC 951]KDN46301.1 26S proteasome regulatory complex, non-ATPase subcomplex, Rpn1 subunit [Tilletiaria anomala UBC 951]